MNLWADGYWPWWLGALGLAGVTSLVWFVERRLLGVSGAYREVMRRRTAEERSLAGAGDSAVEDAMVQATLAEFGPEAVEEFLREQRASAGVEASTTDPPGDRSLRRAPRRDPLPRSTSIAFLALLPVGGFLGALVGGGWSPQPVLDSFHASLFGGATVSYAVLLAGGLLVGFGTRMSGGCTSGHGLSGCGRLDKASLVGTASFFATAVVVSLLLQAVLL